jgi:RimJ/RimL family protein N-acetyltransferase
VKIQMAAPSRFEWLLERAGGPMTPAFKALEIVDRRDTTVAMVGFDNWTPTSAQVFIAIDAPIAARFAGPVLSFAFAYHKLKLIWGLVGAANERSLRFAKRIGFVEKARIEDAWKEGEDMVLIQLTGSDASRWLSAGRKAA